MSNTQHTAKKNLPAALLAAVIVSAAVLTGCGGNSESSEATADQIVKGTSIVTYTETVPQTGSSSAKASQSTTAAKQSSQKQQTTTKANSSGQSSQSAAANNNANNQTSKSNNNNQQNSKSGGSSNNGGNNGGNNSSGNRSAAPSAASNAPANKKSEPNKSASDLTIGNKHFKVGDTVTCTYYLKVPVKMLNFQGSAYFDPSLLELTDAYLIEPANNGGMLNNNLKDHVSFNGSNLSGYDFIDECYPFITVEYKVTGTGVTQPGITFDVITDVNDKMYAADNGTVTNGAEIKEEYK